MVKVAARSLWMVLILFVGGTGSLQAESGQISGQEKAPGGMMPAIVEQDLPKTGPMYEGALDIRIHGEEDRLNPPAELLLITSEGRRVGKDPRTGETFSEIPNSFYEYEGIADLESGAPGPETGIVYVGNPVNVEFTLKVIGKESFAYVLEVRGYDCEMGYSGETFDHVNINQNAEHTYLIKYSNEKGGRVEVTRILPLSP
jgi:hypothetical protein